MELFDLLGYDYHKEYNCSSITKSKYFNKLMFLLINIDKIDMKILINYILSNKNEINEKNEKGWTALHIASRNSRKINFFTDIIKLLLENGADINRKNNNGWTALMHAARYSNIDSNNETVKLLLENGADINIKNNSGLTALMHAAQKSNISSNNETVKLLLENGADINIKNNDGNTVLILAIHNSNNDTVKILLENRADVEIKNNNNETFFSYIDKNNAVSNELLKIIYQIKHHELSMKKILKQLLLNFNMLLLNPNSIRIKIMNIKWEINKCHDNESVKKLYTKLVDDNMDILDYLNIYDADSLQTKIGDVVKNIDY